MSVQIGRRDMSISTPLTALLGIQHPILSAPMDTIAGARLAAAVSAAGGFGILGGGYGDKAWLERETAKLKQLATVTDGTYHPVSDPSGPAAISNTIRVHFKLVSEHTEVTGLFCAIAVGLLLLGALASVRWFGRIA